MKRCVIFVCCAALVAAAVAQSPQKPIDRSKLILQIARERASRQNDAWFNDGDFPRAIQSLRVLHELFPHDYDLETDLGWMYENVEDYGSAISLYIAYRQGFPGDIDSEYPEAELYFRRKLYSKVPPLVEPALRRGTKDPNSFRILAISYERLGLFQDSKRVWDAYLVVAPNDEQAKNNRERVEKKRTGALQVKPSAKA